MKSAALALLARAGKTLRHTPLARSRTLNRIQAALAVRLNGSNEARVGPFRVRFDPRERVLSKRLLLYGGQEQGEIALLCSLVRPGDHALDVGANVGLYSLFLSRAVGPAGRVVAVEPDPETAELLRENLAVNGCDNVTVLGCALAAQDGRARLFRVEGHRGNASLADLQGTGRSVEVELRRGEEALAALGGAPRVAKIDVEGAEPLVFAGLGQALPEVVLFECVPRHMREMGCDPLAFLESLAGQGYRLELVDPGTARRTELPPRRIVEATGDARRVHNVLATRAGALS
jgi:FkbM family methyltransferase